jgi:hypothetical protein
MFFFVFNHNLLFFCAFFFSILFGTKLFFSIGPCCWSSWRCLLRRVDVLIERIGCHSMCLIVSSHNHRENNRSKSHRVHCIGGRGNCDEKNEHQRILQDEHKLVPAQQHNQNQHVSRNRTGLSVLIHRALRIRTSCRRKLFESKKEKRM